MLPDPFDRASRYLLRHNLPVLAWLLALSPEEFDFAQWLDTRRIPWPGSPERTCDTVAHLRDLGSGGVPWAVVVEIATIPDPDITARLLVYMGQIMLDLRPTNLPGDRFCVGAVVVNLTGKADSSRDMHWQRAGLRTLIQIPERNLAGLSARTFLDEVAAGKAPRAALAWLPVMQGDNEDGMITRWLELADKETDPGKRADLGSLVLVFAEVAGCRDAWKEALKEWNMSESQVVKEWMREGEVKGEIKGRVETIRTFLETKLGSMPADLATALRAITDVNRLNALVPLAVRAASFDQFRQDANL